MKLLFVSFFLPLLAFPAETHSLTLSQAVDLALRQNPDVVIARLDEQKAQMAIRVAKDPFVPKLYAGSGLAKIWGYPNSIEGSAPSIVQAKTDMAIFNRPKSYALAQTRESARGAAIATHSKMDEVVYRTAAAFLDAAQAGRSVEIARHQMESQERIQDLVRARVGEGREIPLAVRRAEVDLARTRQRIAGLTTDASYAEGSLAIILGYPQDDRVHPVMDDDALSAALEKAQPESADSAVEAAIRSSNDLKGLESQMQAKSLEFRSQKATRLPQINLVGQYALFAKYNYQDYFVRRFQRNNGELGVSISVPLLVGSAASALASQAEIDLDRLRQQVGLQRNQISLETRRSYEEVKNATDARSLAKLDLEVAREQLSIYLAQLDEGRATAQQVEEARVMEQEKWMQFYGAQDKLERARMNLLRQTGELLAALR